MTHTIVHRIRLRPAVDPQQFEAWVRDTDYTACAQLPSLVRFCVHAVSGCPSEYFEVITADSADGFARDTASVVFGRLEAEFVRFAEVVDEIAGEPIANGYARTEVL